MQESEIRCVTSARRGGEAGARTSCEDIYIRLNLGAASDVHAPLKQGPFGLPSQCYVYWEESEFESPAVITILEKWQGGIKWEQEKLSLMLCHFNFVLA